MATCGLVCAASFGISHRGAKAGPLISPVAASGTGTFSNSPSLIIDGILPPRSTIYTNATNVYWSGTTPQFTIDFGAVYTVGSLIADIDNNDDYVIQYSVDNTSYTNLFTFLAADGPVSSNPGGLDILTTDSAYPSAVNYPTDTTTPEYVGRSFAPVNARYLRISGSGGDGLYAIGELQAFQPAPEPAGTAVLGGGFMGLLAVCWRRRALNRKAGGIS